MTFSTFKDAFKKIPYLEPVNSLIKSKSIDYHSRSLSRYYSHKCTASHVQYSAIHAISSFIDVCKLRNQSFQPSEPGSLNIFWVGGSEAQDQSGILPSMRSLGSVHCFRNVYNQYGPIVEKSGCKWQSVRRLNDECLFRQVVEVHMHSKINLLIGQMWADLYSPSALSSIQKLGIPIINISMDDRLPSLWHYRNRELMGAVGLADSVDITLTTCEDVLPWYASEGMPALYWPLASHHNFSADPQNSLRDIDVLFIGNKYGVRGSLVKRLISDGIPVTCFGRGWPNGYADADFSASISKRAKIILGFSTVGHSKTLCTLKLRDFDSLMSGALYITQRNSDLLRIFDEDRHLCCYGNYEELLSKLRLYLSNEQLRLQIASNGFSYVSEFHTWDIRLTDTFRNLHLLR